MIETEPIIEAEEASEVMGDLKDEDKVEEVNSPQQTMKKQSKKQRFARNRGKENFSKRRRYEKSQI